MKAPTHKPATGHPLLGHPTMLLAFGTGTVRSAMCHGWRLIGIRTRLDADPDGGEWYEDIHDVTTGDVGAGDVEWWLARTGRDGAERTIVYSARLGWDGRQE